MNRDDVRKIFEDVKANHARLEACDGPHEFVVANPDQMVLRQRYRCTRCGGELERSNYHWYQRGLAHGSKR